MAEFIVQRKKKKRIVSVTIAGEDHVEASTAEFERLKAEGIEPQIEHFNGVSQITYQRPVIEQPKMMMMFDGEMLSASEIAERIGITVHALYGRIRLHGERKALAAPKRTRKQMKAHFCRLMFQAEKEFRDLNQQHNSRRGL